MGARFKIVNGRLIELRATAATREIRDRIGEARAIDPGGQPGVRLHLIKPNVVDDWGSMWQADTFDESLGIRLPVLVWAHDWCEPLGRGIDYKTSKQGPEVDFVFDDFDAVPIARRAYAQVKSGTIEDCSVGFSDTQRRDPTDQEERKYPGIREVIEKSTCDETSLVLRGAVPGANVVQIRSARGGVGTVSEDLAISLAKRVVAGEITQDEAAIAIALAAQTDPAGSEGGDGGTGGKTPEELAAEATAAEEAAAAAKLEADNEIEAALAEVDEVLSSLERSR